VSCFLGGSRKDIRMTVHMFQPTIVHKAFSLARMYEAANTSTNIDSSWYLTKNKGIFCPKPVSADKMEFHKSSDRN